MKKSSNGAPRFRVGDWVMYPRWPERQRALIIEYRGPLGVGGEHVYRLRRVFDWGEVHEFEQVESDLHPAEAPTPMS